MNKLNKYAFSDLYDIASGISTTKTQAGHGTPFVSFSTVFNNIFLPDELPDLMDTSEQEQETYSIRKGDILITRTSETADELCSSQRLSGSNLQRICEKTTSKDNRSCL